jgi:hypothetical protein
MTTKPQFAAADFPNVGPGATQRYSPPIYLFGLANGLGQAIADTALHAPAQLLKQQVPQGRSIFTIYNGCNQAITVTLVGDNINNPGGAPSIGGGVTVAANSNGTLATDVSSEWLGVSAQYTVAPSSGTLVVRGSTELP